MLTVKYFYRFIISKSWWDEFIEWTTKNEETKSNWEEDESDTTAMDEDEETTTVKSVKSIDNSTIIDKSSTQLRSNLVEKLDYILVPDRSYQLLKRAFGLRSAADELERNVIASGLFTKTEKVEVYQLSLNIATAQQPDCIKSLVLSRSQTVGESYRI